MRVALGLLLALLLAAPASAAAPPPTILDFEDQPVGTSVFDLYIGHPEVAFSDGDSCGSVQSGGGNFGPRYLDTSCQPITIEFREPQAVVSLYAIATSASGRRAALGPTAPPSIEVHTFDTTGQPMGAVPVDAPENTWTPVVATSPDYSASIGYVRVDTTRDFIGIDDIGFSPVPQPDTEITSGPSGTVTNGEAAFDFVANQDRVTFACKLDAAPSEPCASQKTYSGLADGTHTFTVVTIDRWGATDATPATRTWTVRRTAPPPDRDADGVADATDNCPDIANSGQGDGDKDGVGDVCEQLPPGTAPIEAGKATKVKLVSGEVFVKLPPGASAGAFTAGLRVPFQDGGFIPLKGVATVPLGSTLDTRKGQVALTAAINGQAAGNRRQLRREARFRAGIFAIRQARRSRKRARKKKIPVRAELVSASGAQARCARSAPGGGPLKGVTVRSLSMTAKGLFRAVGGAATAAPVKGTATFITTDRCDGTVTEVGRGRVAVVSKRTGRKRTVRVGQAYLVRARLFAARKGRPN